MPFVYVPEKWRKKFTPEQKVWYLDHVNCEIKTGRFQNYTPHDHECEDTVWILIDKYGGRTCTLEAWTFTNPEDVAKTLKRMLSNRIAEKEHELKKLREKLGEFK